MKNNEINLDMELTIEGLGETLNFTNGSLIIGSEYDHSKTSVFLEDISQVQNKKLIERLKGLNKVVSEACQEIKELAVEAYKNEPMIEGILDKGHFENNID